MSDLTLLGLSDRGGGPIVKDRREHGNPMRLLSVLIVCMTCLISTGGTALARVLGNDVLADKSSRLAKRKYRSQANSVTASYYSDGS